MLSGLCVTAAKDFGVAVVSIIFSLLRVEHRSELRRYELAMVKPSL